MKKMFILLGLCLGVSGSLTGCKIQVQRLVSQENSVLLPYQLIADEHARIFLPMEEDSYEMKQALAYIGEFLSGEAGWQETQEGVEFYLQRFQKKKDALETYTISPELTDALLQYEISPEDFELFGNTRSNNLQGYIDDLYTLYYLLENSNEFDFQKDIIASLYEIDQDFLENEQGFYFYAYINNWFYNWEEEQLDYVQKQVLNKLKFCQPDKFAWETNYDVIEKKAMTFLQILEEHNSETIELVADEEQSFFQQKKDVADLEKLELEYDALDDEEEKLEQLKRLHAQMEKVADNVPNSEKQELKRRLERMARIIARKSGEEDNFYQRVVKEYTEVIFPMDEDGYLYGCAFSDVGDYLAGDGTKEAALESVQEAIKRLRERESAWEDYSVSLEMSDLMKEYGISSENFEIAVNSWPDTLQYYLVDLDRIFPYLQKADEYNDEYKMTALCYGLNVPKWELKRMDHFYTYVNDWFAGWEDQKLSYVQEQVLDKLKCFAPEGYVWETDKNVIFEKKEGYITSMEALIDSLPELREEIEEEYNRKKEAADRES